MFKITINFRGKAKRSLRDSFQFDFLIRLWLFSF